MKIITMSGTRPDLIRLIPTIKKLDGYSYIIEHKFAWLNQNFESCIGQQFIEEFNKSPDWIYPNELQLSGIQYIGDLIKHLEIYLKIEKPDCVLTLGDTNATFAAVLVSKKLGIPIFHIESGNRCFDTNRVPEEINRYMIDSIADWHLCYTQRSREHLLREGKFPDRIIMIGNPIIECLNNVVTNKELYIKYKDNFFLVTLHRKENIEDISRLKNILYYLNELNIKILLSNHPSFRNKTENLNFTKEFPNIKLIEPPNFQDFITLESLSKCIITDSGTIPEEAYYLNKPCVLLRFSTERPELLEHNAMVMCSEPENLVTSVEIALNEHTTKNLEIKEYHDQVSNNIIKLLMRWKK